uniref:Uncharacterized protein n=1 Tax=Spongospora subterranea TaxID=70186 RepID=A0A0H5QN67_9EUKA|eukprot:CRZ02992.1 hypothetical protein [Spongospora subterranea]
MLSATMNEHDLDLKGLAGFLAPTAHLDLDRQSRSSRRHWLSSVATNRTPIVAREVNHEIQGISCWNSENDEILSGNFTTRQVTIVPFPAPFIGAKVGHTLLHLFLGKPNNGICDEN